MTTIAIIGAGWRAEFDIRIAQLLPERFEIVGVVARKEDVRNALTQEYGVKAFSSISQLLSHKNLTMQLVVSRGIQTPALSPA